MNEVQTMAKAGENIGAAVGTALMTARQGATVASKTSAAASRRLARSTAAQTRRKLAESGIDRAQLRELQDAFAESLWRARHELASKIEPPTRRRTPRLRLLMAIAMVAAVAGAIASVISKRPLRLQEAERDRRQQDRADLMGNGAPTYPPEPSEAEPSRPTSAAHQTTGRGLTGPNSSPS